MVTCLARPLDKQLISYRNQRKYYEENLLKALGQEASLLLELEGYEEAIEICGKALAIEPKDAEAWRTLGIALAHSRQYKEAILAYQNALKLDAPSAYHIYHDLSYCSLILGKFNRGFKELEARLERYKTVPLIPNLKTSKRWEGEDISGKTLLVHHEGSLRDSIQFMRYIPFLKRYNCHILLFLQPELNGLFENFGVDLIKDSDKFYTYDVHVFAKSLPYCFNTQLSTIPLPVNIGGASRPTKGRVGIFWRAGKKTKNKKNIDLKELTPLLSLQGLQYVCLQKEVTQEEAILLKRFSVECPAIHSFEDTVKLLETCEQVISIDSAVAHLSASMGTPTRMLLPYNACWRWLIDRRDSPWYPSLTLFRQKRMHIWEDPLREIQEELKRTMSQEKGV